ncbi:S8 family serine peptidase [Flavobacterium sp. MK4S-17]|uniref:S8 family serine peptidase n=1 Tax=Flavobacterium sp. MK4S-17 TaxID=2543737 RepID=UPI001356F04C|nr:S8 family serine peptidase [Flavobacterium sp. MK4S-17]
MKKNTIKAVFLASFIFGGVAVMFGQTPKEREKIIQHYDLKKAQALIEYHSARMKKDKEEALRMAKEKGWPVTFTDENDAYNELMRVGENGEPVYYVTHNFGSAITARVNKINTNGGNGLNLNGQGMILGIWDGGPVRSTHQDLTGRVQFRDEAFFTHTEGTGHATHVAGTMMGSGFGNTAAKGLAYEATLWGHTFANDIPEAVQRAQEGLLVSNHSYGANIASIPAYQKGAYIGESANWDDIMHTFDMYQPVFSAGNDRGTPQDTQGGRDLLTDKATTKNGVVVAAVNQVLNYTGPSSVVMSSFSSWGPTDDFRIKPDISAKGVSVLSTYSTSTTAYQSLQGTSMAAPAVSACLILMQQHFNNLNSQYMKSATLRALMVNSADEAGTTPGPDHKFGWGLINAERAVNIISTRNTSSIIEELTLQQGQTYTRTIKASGNVPLKVTVAWTDPAGPVNTGVNNDPTPVLVNDLDVRVTKVAGGNEYFPWMLNPLFLLGGAIQGDNVVDNIESIEVENPTGEYLVTVTHKGTLLGGSQDYSIVVNGVVDVNSVSENTSDSLVVYPNPVSSGSVRVNLADYNLSDFTLSLYDMNGRKVIEKKYANESEVALDVSMVSSGVYLLNLEGSGKTLTKKLIVQ